MNGTIATGLSKADERVLIAASLDGLATVTGQPPTGWPDAEADSGGRMVPVHQTPSISALPYRIDAIAALLAWPADEPGAWFARSDELVAAARPQIAPFTAPG